VKLRVFFIGEKKGRGLIDRIKFLDAVRRVFSLSDFPGWLIIWGFTGKPFGDLGQTPRMSL